jgi:REP element-mobilizing transposase RayT
MGNDNQIEGFMKRRRHLPHWEIPGAEYFISFHLDDSSLCNLTRDDIGKIILESVEWFDAKRYYLLDFTIMPTHIHMVIKVAVSHNTSESISSIMKSIKGYTAYKINTILGRRGKFWQDESYDRIIRDEEEYRKFAKYIFENPVKAGLIERGENWKWWRYYKR